MAVPNTTTFSLQDVVTEVVPTTNDLIDCFADANANEFDAAYRGDKTNLLNFRNYGASVATLQAIYINFKYLDKFQAANDWRVGGEIVYFWFTTFDEWLVGDIVYADASESAFTGGDNYIRVTGQYEQPKQVARFDTSTGEIISIETLAGNPYPIGSNSYSTSALALAGSTGTSMLYYSEDGFGIGTTILKYADGTAMDGSNLWRVVAQGGSPTNVVQINSLGVVINTAS